MSEIEIMKKNLSTQMNLLNAALANAYTHELPEVSNSLCEIVRTFISVLDFESAQATKELQKEIWR